VPAVANSNSSTSISVEGFVAQTPGASNCNVNEIGADYFRTMGIPLVAGREFTRTDTSTAPKVAIVNEAFVRYYLPNQNPIGWRMARGTGDKIKLDTEIVGVVKDAKYSSVRETEPKRVFYMPYQQLQRQFWAYFYVRTAIEPEQIAPVIRREVAALDPHLPIRDLKTMEKQIEENLYAERLFSVLTGSFAGLATLLAAIGLYGVLAYNVTRRTREIGIRMALGAESRHVRGLVVREVVLMLVIGAAVGLASAAAAGRLVQSVLYGLKPWDPLVYVSATVLLGTIAVVAAYLPARRATSVDPTVALRYE
jgi:putative ABC transport system permease protein